MQKQAKKFDLEDCRKPMRAIAADAKQNLKGSWCHVSVANPSKNNIPDLMKEDDIKTSEAEEKVDLLNSSFVTNFSTQPIANTPPTLPEQPIREPVYMIIISIENGLKRLKSMDANRAAEEICEPIAVMYGMSLNSTVLPSDWKQTNIKSIFKKGRMDQASFIAQ